MFGRSGADLRKAGIEATCRRCYPEDLERGIAMKSFLAIAVALATFTPGAAAQVVPPGEPITTEHYYRIKWGSAGEFKRLYKLNHQPILAELQKQGFITAIRTDEPFTHMAGNQRWDLRVTITYRDSSAAVVVGGAFDKASEAVTARLSRSIGT